ncbi:MAG: Rdx family protein [Phycisphaerales bacterium]|nr:MAG: Rdx family protein [Phycisphaerales bacterium]
MAASLAKAIKDKYGVDCKLIEGGGGIFDVKVNGTQVWCKQKVGRFPEPREVFEQIDSLVKT